MEKYLVMALGFFTVFLGLVPVCLLLLYSKKVKSINIRAIKPLLWLIFFAGFYEIIATLILKLPADIWFRVYLLLEFYALFYFFYTLFKKKYKLLLWGYAIVYGIIWLALWYVWNVWSNIRSDSYLFLFESVFVYTFVILWFRELFNSATVVSLWQVPVFYFICSFVFYFSGTLFLFLLSGSMLENPAISLEKYWMVNVIGTLFMRIFLIIGMWKALKN